MARHKGFTVLPMKIFRFKKIVLLLALTTSFVFAKVHYAKDYASALAQAKNEDKKILLMLSKEECPACWWMKNNAFTNEELAERLNENFVTVVVDVEKDEIPMNLDFMGTPTFYFLNSEQDQLSRIDGARNVSQMNKRIDFLLR